jgi:hypothetical protein
MKKPILLFTAALLALAGIIASCKEKNVTEEPPIIPPVEPTIELELGVYADQGLCINCSKIELIDRENLAFRNLNYPDQYRKYKIIGDSIKITGGIPEITTTNWFHIIDTIKFEMELTNEQISVIKTYKKIH